MFSEFLVSRRVDWKLAAKRYRMVADIELRDFVSFCFIHVHVTIMVYGKVIYVNIVKVFQLISNSRGKRYDLKSLFHL